MNPRIAYYLCCCVAAIALPLPCGAQTTWVFTSVKSSFNGQPGAKGDGIDDDTAAINRAIAAGSAVYFPPGIYRYIGLMGLPANKSFRIYGDGPGVSIIHFETDGTHQAAGISAPTRDPLITLNVEFLTLAATTANCGTAIYAAFSNSVDNFRTATIHNVEVIGEPRAGAPNWTKGIDLVNANNTFIDKVDITGTWSPNPGEGTLTGIAWKQSGPNKVSGLQATNLECKFVQTALETGGLVDGVYLTGFELAFCSRQGIPVVDLATTAPGGTQQSTFHLVNGHVQGLGDGVRLTNLTGIKISKVHFLHNSAPISGCSMIQFNNCSDAVVSKCSFLGSFSTLANENGIILNSTHSVRIAENVFSSFVATTGSAVVVQSSSDTVRITNNLFGAYINGDVLRPYDDGRPGDTYYRGNNR